MITVIAEKGFSYVTEGKNYTLRRKTKKFKTIPSQVSEAEAELAGQINNIMGYSKIFFMSGNTVLNIFVSGLLS
jgi:hypothetical protein